MKIKKALQTVLCILMVLSLTCLSGCASADKDDATISLHNIRFEYYENTNITTIFCDAQIENKTMYNIRSFDLTIAIFCDGVNTETPTKCFSHNVMHEKTEYNVSLVFTAEGHVDLIALSSWEPHYDTFWKTYFPIFVKDES